MYTLDAIQVKTPLARQPGLRTPQIRPKTAPPRTRPSATSSTQPSNRPGSTSSTQPPPIVVVVPKTREEKSAEPDVPWYKSPGFVGTVASTVVIAALSFGVKKLGGETP